MSEKLKRLERVNLCGLYDSAKVTVVHKPYNTPKVIGKNVPPFLLYKSSKMSPFFTKFDFFRVRGKNSKISTRFFSKRGQCQNISVRCVDIAARTMMTSIAGHCRDVLVQKTDSWIFESHSRFGFVVCKLTSLTKISAK